MRQVDERLDFLDHRWYATENTLIRFCDASGILLRLDRPVSDEFLLALEAASEGIPTVNSPRGIVECGSKLFLLDFPELCPGISIVRSIDDVWSRSGGRSIVLKPMRGYGGAGILRVGNGGWVDDGDSVFKGSAGRALLASSIKASGGEMMAMDYMTRISEGDKRVLLVEGKPVAAVLRLPRESGWICNLNRGGRARPTEIEEGDREIAEVVGRRLVARGVIIAGIDTLTDDDGGRVLSEINCLNVGGFVQADESGASSSIDGAANAILKAWSMK
ncbi:MAG: hypothetical protein ACRD0K_22910 [Egibacteraceae bacterium]